MKRAEIEWKYIIGLIIMLVVVLFFVIGATNIDPSKWFGELPDFNESVDDSLINNGLILGNEVKVLLDDGQGRCIVYETEKGNSELLKDYGLKNGNEWVDIDDSIADSDRTWKKSLKDTLVDKKDDIRFNYNNEIYSGNDILRLSENEDVELNRLFYDFIILNENKLEFNDELLRLRLEYGERIFNEVGNSLLWVSAGTKTSYAIDKDDGFYFREGIGKWIKFIGIDNNYLYIEGSWKVMTNNRDIKRDLVKACKNE